MSLVHLFVDLLANEHVFTGGVHEYLILYQEFLKSKLDLSVLLFLYTRCTLINRVKG